MKLDYAILAKATEVNEKHHVHIFGGGFNKLETSKFPFVIPFALALRFAEEHSRIAEEHSFDITLTLPDGTLRRLATSKIKFVPNELHLADDSWAVFAVDVVGKFDTPGRYLIGIESEGKSLASLPLYVYQSASETNVPAEKEEQSHEVK